MCARARFDRLPRIAHHEREVTDTLLGARSRYHSRESVMIWSRVLVGLVICAYSAALPLQNEAQSKPPKHIHTDVYTQPVQVNSPAVATSAPMNATLTDFLTEISDWIMTTGVGSNVLNNASYFGDLSSIFVNGTTVFCPVIPSSNNSMCGDRRSALPIS